MFQFGKYWYSLSREAYFNRKEEHYGHQKMKVRHCNNSYNALVKNKVQRPRFRAQGFAQMRWKYLRVTSDVLGWKTTSRLTIAHQETKRRKHAPSSWALGMYGQWYQWWQLSSTWNWAECRQISLPSRKPGYQGQNLFERDFSRGDQGAWRGIRTQEHLTGNHHPANKENGKNVISPAQHFGWTSRPDRSLRTNSDFLCRS